MKGRSAKHFCTRHSVGKASVSGDWQLLPGLSTATSGCARLYEFHGADGVSVPCI